MLRRYKKHVRDATNSFNHIVRNLGMLINSYEDVGDSEKAQKTRSVLKRYVELLAIPEFMQRELNEEFDRNRSIEEYIYESHDLLIPSALFLESYV